MSFAEKLNMIYSYLEPVVSILDFASMFIVLWGFLIGFLRFIYIEFFHPQGKFIQYQELRRSVGLYIILGLEFMIVADLLQTISQERSYESLIALGALVTIRTVVTYFLMREMKDAEREEKDFSMGLRAVGSTAAPEVVEVKSTNKKA
jgi:uncharacterized membrane protein